MDLKAVRQPNALWTSLVATMLIGCSIAAHAERRHHALIIGVGQYTTASGASPLLGVPRDLATARRMALAMGVPSQRITELRDNQATKANIVAALERLRQDVGPGEKVFLYFSGHGTSFTTPQGCQEGLMPYTQGRHTVDDLITEAELASYTSRISERSDKAVVMIDACFSGGLGASRTRSLTGALAIRPKFVARAGEACGVPVNQRLTRSFTPAMQRLGVPDQNFVQISAANYNEVSWDNEQLGGLATHFLGQCLLGEAKDLNRSGAISLEEVRQCAQVRLNELMAPHKAAGLLPSTIQIRGTRNLIVVQEPPKPTALPEPVPAPVAEEATLDVAVAVAAPVPPLATVEAPMLAPAEPPSPPVESAPPAALHPPASTPVAVQPVVPPVVPPDVPPDSQPPPATMAAIPSPQPATTVEIQPQPSSPQEQPAAQLASSAATMEDIHAQRDGRLLLEVSAPKRLTIGKDPFTFDLRSNTDGHLYAVMLGSDGKSFYLLFPNKLDDDNRVKAGVRYTFPRPGWSIQAGGPQGTNRVLFVVSPSARDPKIFAPDDAGGGGPFTFSLAEMTARQRLVDFFLGRGVQGSDGRIASALVEIEEVP